MVRYGVKDLVPSTFCHLFPSAKLSHLQNCFNQPKSKHSTFFSLVDSLSQKFFITKFFLLLIATSFINLIYYFYGRKLFSIPPTPLLVFHTLHVTHGYHFLTSKTNLKPSHKVNGSVNSKLMPFLNPGAFAGHFSGICHPVSPSCGELVGHFVNFSISH